MWWSLGERQQNEVLQNGYVTINENEFSSLSYSKYNYIIHKYMNNLINLYDYLITYYSFVFPTSDLTDSPIFKRKLSVAWNGQKKWSRAKIDDLDFRFALKRAINHFPRGLVQSTGEFSDIKAIFLQRVSFGWKRDSPLFRLQNSLYT